MTHPATCTKSPSFACRSSAAERTTTPPQIVPPIMHRDCLPTVEPGTRVVSPPGALRYSSAPAAASLPPRALIHCCCGSSGPSSLPAPFGWPQRISAMFQFYLVSSTHPPAPAASAHLRFSSGTRPARSFRRPESPITVHAIQPAPLPPACGAARIPGAHPQAQSTIALMLHHARHCDTLHVDRLHSQPVPLHASFSPSTATGM